MTNEVRCTAGQLEQPTDETCHRHGEHHWCGWCAGWYGVPHSTPAGVCHSEEFATHGHVAHAHATCACRYCRIFWAQGAQIARETFSTSGGDLPVPEPVAALRSQQSDRSAGSVPGRGFDCT